MALFVLPPAEVFSDPSHAVHGGLYSHYNYLRPGMIQKLKRGRFEKALAMAKPYFRTGAALDFGCADGVFLPSLAKYFDVVAGVDTEPGYVEAAQSMVDAMALSNVSLVCNRGMSIGALAERLGRKFRIAFVLETLEHVGSLPALYESKTDFVEDLFSLLEPGGLIVASVPRMVDVRFLAKHVIQLSLRVPTEKFGFGNLMRASLMRDTSRLEPRWSGAHLGFNHLRLTEALRKRFDIKVSGTVTRVFYTIRLRKST
jgi:2-polyprenyl-3-methyl-5-hydroxy-6-metoxy-1,4-benzoquinol methylase